MTDSPERAHALARRLRRLGMRALISGALAASVAFWLATAMPASVPFPLTPLELAVCAFIGAFFLQAASFVEMAAEKWRTRRHDQWVAALAGLVALVMLVFSALEIAYVSELRSGRLTAGFEAVRNVSGAMLRNRHQVVILVTLAVPFAPATWARLRRLPVPKEVAVTLGVSAFILTPVLAVSWVRELRLPGLIALGEAAALPLVWRLGDFSEERVRRWLSQREEA
ncbi:hypothetical protein HY251_05410 [bacterium]|nr:hypothetical protein [bacterium]